MRKNTIEDFHARIERGEECWLWTGTRTSHGYGQFRMDGTDYAAHRLSYEIAKGPIPEGLHIDHLCRTPPCVNPDHLEPVTPAENMRRGILSYALRKVCRAGLHDITKPEAVIVGPHGRQCRECNRESQRRSQRSEKARARKREWVRAKRAQMRQEREVKP